MDRKRIVLAALLACGCAVLPTTSASAASTSLPTQWTIPNGWLLRPAGTQVLTEREPTGLSVAPDGSAAYTVSSGIFDEGVERIDAQTLAPAPTLIGSLWLGVVADGQGDVYAAGGASDKVYRLQQEGPALVDTGPAGAAPSNPEAQGTSVLGWPGELVLSGTTGAVKNKLFVAGNLSVPQSAIEGADPSAGPCPGGAPAADPICSAVSVLDVSTPSSPVVQHVIPVGRDAYGMTFAGSTGTLYVANWADRTNPSRANGNGTVSVVHIAANGSGHEAQAVPVGLDPTGAALSPDGSTLAVADTGSDQVTLLSLDRSTGAVTSTRSVSVGVPGAPLGTQPIGVAYAPDGHLFVTLTGLNAVEVLTPAGRPIPQRVTVPWLGHNVRVSSPATYIPVGWYPDAAAVGANPAGGSRLYVANFYGMGAGPGFNGEAAPVTGSRTEGSVSAIDLPGAASSASTYRAWTATVVENDDLAPLYDPRLVNPATDPCAGATLPGGGHVTSRLLCAASRGHLDPRHLHVVMLFDENKTFDSYFGDVGTYFPGAKADPSFATYPYSVTTNHHLIAEQFNLSENFYNQGFDSSVLGHQFIEAGMATPFDQLDWAQSYDPNSLRGDRKGGEWSGEASGGKTDGNIAAQEGAMNAPPQQIFDLLQNPADNRLGLSERVYSTDWGPSSAAARADQAPAALWGQGPHPIGGGDDETYSDTDRANLFLTGQTVSHNWDANSGGPPSSFGQEVGYCGGPSKDCSYDGAKPTDYSRFTLAAWTSAYRQCLAAGGSDASCQSSMPNFDFMVLPQNAGGLADADPETNPLDPTPEAMVADNDNAVGQIVQGLSHSPFWKNTVVLVTEDDTQTTGDHVDVARTYLLAAGGLVRPLGPRHQLSDQRTGFDSALRTVEILFGLPAMTLYDATATPLDQVIGDRIPANPPAYTAVTPQAPFLIGSNLPASAAARLPAP